ncbi:hypothetical protein H0H92_014213 [Tricholoma furcatifolium]|nr:hypothetical protein H0H92_014213 [Tricholoma furcatifolium]
MNAEPSANAGVPANDAETNTHDREIDSDDKDTVEPNVIGKTTTSIAITTHELPMTTADPLFHSPSAIVGTPFTSDSRFEYPFPKAGDPSSAMILSSSFPSIAPVVPVTTDPVHPLHGLSSAPASITSFPPIFIPTNLPPYALTHPKMRATPPPVPPGLAKKRQRWSLALPILRRRNSQPNEPSPGTESKESRSASTPPAESLALVKKS